MNTAQQDEANAGFALERVTVTGSAGAILHELQLSLARAAANAVIGPSGSGKSTLLRVLNRLVEPSSGHVSWRGRALPDFDVRALRREVGLVVQQPRLSPGSAAFNLDLPVRLGAVPEEAAASRRELACEIAGLDRQLLQREQHELSGGERQRVALARALMLEPRALLLDEPTAALDPRSARRLLDALTGLRARERLTLVIVTHRIEEVALHAEHLVVLSQGRVVEEGPAPSLLKHPQTEVLADLLDRGPRRATTT